MVKGHVHGQPFWDRASIKGTLMAIGLGAVVVGAGIVINIKLGRPGGLAIVSGLVCCGLAFTILRYTPEMKLLRKRLQALRRYLKTYHSRTTRGQNILQNIQNYLVFAVALGVGASVIQRLLETVPAYQHQVYFPWYAAGAHAATENFAAAVSSFVSVANSSMSSAAGVGGGASVGGGGGAGGAAGGAG